MGQKQSKPTETAQMPPKSAETAQNHPKPAEMRTAQENPGGRPPTPAPTINITSDDVVIAVVGLTGVGKSKFISYFSDTAVVGHDIESCTSTISIHTARVDGQDIYLIDTPGFDDTTRSDTEILEDVAAWLKRSYDARITLAGIIYLHRIQDNRVGGPGAANIRMFKELCGADRLSCVVLATTRWDSLSDERARSQAIAREDELKSTPGFWGELVRCGARVCRQDEGVRSAEKIVADLVQLRMRTTLRIQEEVADGVPVNETGAGRVVEDEMKKMKAEMATMKKWIEDLLEKQAQQKKAAEEERAKWDAEREDQRRRKEEKRRKKEEEELPKRKKETEEYEEKRKAWEREKQQWEENRKARRTIEELEEKIKALEQGFRESGNRQKPKDADEKADSTNQPTNPPKSRTCILM